MAATSRRKMSISILIPFAIVALVFVTLIWKKMHDSREVKPAPQINEPASGRKGVLFFVADGTRLGREARELESCGEATDCLKDLLDELVSGPVSELDEALPGASAVNGVRLVGDLAVVDMNHSFAADMPAGSSAEMLAVYSIVNTVCANYPHVARVKINVEGNEKTVLGHLDLGDPLQPDFTLEQAPAVVPSPHNSTTPAAQKGKP